MEGRKICRSQRSQAVPAHPYGKGRQKEDREKVKQIRQSGYTRSIQQRVEADHLG